MRRISSLFTLPIKTIPVPIISLFSGVVMAGMFLYPGEMLRNGAGMLLMSFAALVFFAWYSVRMKFVSVDLNSLYVSGYFKSTVILLLLLLGNAFAQSEWPTFKSTEENFTISLPREPKQERTTARTPLGNGHHIYTTDDNNVSFTVSYSMLDDAPTQSKDIKRTLDMVRDLVAMVTNGKLLTDTEISIDNFPGRLVRIEKDKRIWTVHAYLVKDRVYQLMTTEPKAKEQNASVAKFFESFHLLHPPE